MHLNKAQRWLIPFVLILALTAAYLSRGEWWPGENNAVTSTPLTLYGNIDQREVNLAFQESGRITALKVREGESVRQGQLLATLDPARLNDAMAVARAHAAAQQQVVAALRAGTRPEEISKLEAERDAAAATLHNAEASARRIDDLAQRKLASPQQRDDVHTALDAARAHLSAARATLALALAGPRKQDIAAAQATLQALQAQYALARRNLADSKLYAPRDGLIRTRILEAGDMASPQTPVYTLALINPLWVRAYVDEPALGRLHPGMAATIRTDSYPGKSYRGWVGYISPSAEFTPKTVETADVRTALVYQVRVFVCNPQNELRQGMPATVTIATATATRRVPEQPLPHCAGH